MSLCPPVSPPRRTIPTPKARTVSAKTVPPVERAAREQRAMALLSWMMLALVLAAGLPIFLCMPVWFDTYHYDVCIRTLLHGGVLYRDVFDNNLPGIIWLQTAIRLLVGWRTDAIRLVDLIFYTTGVLLLLRWVRAEPACGRRWPSTPFTCSPRKPAPASATFGCCCRPLSA